MTLILIEVFGTRPESWKCLSSKRFLAFCWWWWRALSNTSLQRCRWSIRLISVECKGHSFQFTHFFLLIRPFINALLRICFCLQDLHCFAPNQLQTLFFFLSVWPGVSQFITITTKESKLRFFLLISKCHLDYKQTWSSLLLSLHLHHLKHSVAFNLKQPLLPLDEKSICIHYLSLPVNSFFFSLLFFCICNYKEHQLCVTNSFLLLIHLICLGCCYTCKVISTTRENRCRCVAVDLT